MKVIVGNCLLVLAFISAIDAGYVNGIWQNESSAPMSASGGYQSANGGYQSVNGGYQSANGYPPSANGYSTSFQPQTQAQTQAQTQTPTQTYSPTTATGGSWPTTGPDPYGRSNSYAPGPAPPYNTSPQHQQS